MDVKPITMLTGTSAKLTTNFKPNYALENMPSVLRSYDHAFVSMLSTACSFGPEIFAEVMLDLIKNPNLTSSHLFRADIFYDSLNDVSYASNAENIDLCSFSKHMKPEYKPLRVYIEGFTLKRSIVRQLVPRNPQLDKAVVQTCHFFQSDTAAADVHHSLVVYVPHVFSANAMPWYHPAVTSIAFLHTYHNNSLIAGANHADYPAGDVSLHYSPFPENPVISERLRRTAFKLISIVHKHGQGRQAGYIKRVHHDLIVPQARFQNTYSRLKARYAKELIGDWREQTDPTKHVFEDLGIAAFLIELWSDMYDTAAQAEHTSTGRASTEESQEKFTGFVDIGCGNGVLVYVLLMEGYQGWGFDARRRKTWDKFPADVQLNLKELVLVPEVFSAASTDGLTLNSSIHNGIFPTGTFVISNHADELTAWTPLLAYLSNSPFMCIPCCSHDLAGNRFRAPMPACKLGRDDRPHDYAACMNLDQPDNATNSEVDESLTISRGTLQPRLTEKPISAYASLSAYVEHLAAMVGYQAEKEMLRIPSTRNAAIIGRASDMTKGRDDHERCSLLLGRVRDIVQNLLKKSVEQSGLEWMARTRSIVKSTNMGH